MPDNVQLTVVHESKLKDLLTANTSIDELHNCEDVVATNNVVSSYQIHKPIATYVGISTNVTNYLAIHQNKLKITIIYWVSKETDSSDSDSPSSPAIPVVRGRECGGSTTCVRGCGISTTHRRGYGNIC